MLSHLIGFHFSLAALLLRLGLGFILADHGYPKLFSRNFGPKGFSNALANLGVPAPMLSAYIVGILEFFGGILILFGFVTRWICAAVAINMLVALFTMRKQPAKQSEIDPNATGAPDLDIALLAMALVLFLIGAGKFSLDFVIFQEW